MNSITDATVNIQTSSESVPATPPWLGEVALLVRHLDRQGVFDARSRAGALCPPPLWSL
jgi:hypothetical protein